MQLQQHNCAIKKLAFEAFELDLMKIVIFTMDAADLLCWKEIKLIRDLEALIRTVLQCFAGLL
jgi:hypothetical protein